MMLFKLDKGRRVVLNKDAALLCPGLKDLTEEELLFVILAYDYSSPYQQLQEEERVRRSRHHVWADSKYITDTPIIRTGVDCYRGLQYDHNRELVIRYKGKIKLLSDALLDATGAKLIKEIDEAIERLGDRIDKLQKQIDQSNDIEQLRGGGELTWIERWQRNLRDFKESKLREGVVELE
jgi:predicted ribosome quality control (RQC) complex YloA/Tae2 family protein